MFGLMSPASCYELFHSPDPVLSYCKAEWFCMLLIYPSWLQTLMIHKDYDREEVDGLKVQKVWTGPKWLDKTSKSDILFRC